MTVRLRGRRFGSFVHAIDTRFGERHGKRQDGEGQDHGIFFGKAEFTPFASLRVCAAGFASTVP
jgi:hypothetical protein